MATYNTAFGALPGIETLTGTRRPQQDEEKPRDFMQQYRAQQQTKPTEAPAPVQTFAQMQAAGQARPAPPMLAPVAAPAAPAQSPMLQQLQQQLVPAAAPAATPAPMAAPTAAAPVTAPAPSVAVEPPLVSAVRAELPPIAEDGSRTFTNVEVPVANAPQYTPANPPPPTAPNGSTYRDVNGLVYTKRNGVWSAEAKAGQAILTGYGALTPTVLQGQTVANLPQGATSGFTSVPALDSFLRQYGTPSTPEEAIRLAAMVGMDPDRLMEYIRQPRRDPFISQEATAAKRQADADQAEFLEWYASNPTEANEYAAFGGNTGKYKWVPARLRNGGPALQLREGWKPSWATDGAAVGATGGAPVGGVAGETFAGAGEVPAGAGEAPAGAGGVVSSASAGASSSATSGIPALTPVPAAERFTGSEQAMELRNRLIRQLELIGQGPSQIQGQAYEALRQTRAAELAAQFGAERSKLEEELAARGLSASTIGAGRYGDIAGQQARAIAGFEAELLQQQAEAEARNRQLYVTGLSELAGMAGQQDLGAFEANLRARQVENDIAFRAAELQQEAALRGRELTLQEARNLADAEYQRGQLTLGYAEISSREKLQASQQKFEAEQSEAERRLRLTMQDRELSADEKRQLNDLTFQRERLSEEKRANGVLEEIRKGELTLNQGTRLISIISQIYNGELPIEAWDTMLRSIGLDPAKWVSYKPTPKAPPPTPPSSGPGANNPPITVGQPPVPSDLSQYSNGQRFVINGVTYYLQNGKLVDGYGRQYAGSSE